jgi:RNA polymerase sigma-70 factor (ECF subfamily)
MYCVAQKTVRFSTIDFSQWTDEELILEYRKTQQREAFEELVKRYERELFNYLRHYLGNTESAEDIFQTTFLQVLTKCDQFEEGRKFRPWLYRIATNQAIDLCRKIKRYQVVSIDETYGVNPDSIKLADLLVGDETDPMLSSINEEQTLQVRKAVERLPDFLRQVLYMVYFQGMSYRDAAESLGIPFGTIKSRLNTAIKKLNHLLADNV